MNKAFVDTGVILDFLTGREPFAVDAAMIFSLSEKKTISLYTTGLVFSNAYYVLRKLGTHERVMEKLSLLAGMITIVSVGPKEVSQALASKFTDFEDALQNYSAVAAGVRAIVTRNVKDYRHSQLAVLSPDQFLAARK